MTVSLFATLFFCGLVILFFAVIFSLSRKVGVPNAYSRYRFSKRRYWNSIFFRGGVTRGSLMAGEHFSDLMSYPKPPFARKKHQRRPWEH